MASGMNTCVRGSGTHSAELIYHNLPREYDDKGVGPQLCPF
jgi:hypothetical protein